MRLSARHIVRLGLQGALFSLLLSAPFVRTERHYIDDLVVNKLVVCNDLGVGGEATINQLVCCNESVGCGGGVTPEAITVDTVSFAELIFTPEDFTPPNCGGAVCEVNSVPTKVFNNLLYECNGRMSSIGLIPLDSDNAVSDLYRMPSVDFKLPLDFIPTGIIEGPTGPTENLIAIFDIHVLIPGTTAAIDDGEVRLELFVDVVNDGDDLGGDDCPDINCITQRTITVPDDCRLLRHYVFRNCIPALDLYNPDTEGPIGETVPWVRVMIDRIDANEPYTGPVYLGVLDFVYAREFENVLYPDQDRIIELCELLNDESPCAP